jgi:hypothetical protein
MKLAIIVMLGVLIASAVFSAGQERMTKAEELIRQLDGRIIEALLEGDLASVDSMLADDYIEINAQGLIKRKPEVMALVRARASAPRSKSVGPEITVETKLHMIGETAILIGLKTTRYQHMDYQTLPQPAQVPAPVATDQERFTKIYARVNGRWQLAAFQTTAIAKR